jgi:hypothetical protein
MAAAAGEASAGQSSAARPACMMSGLPAPRDYAGVHQVDVVCPAKPLARQTAAND